MNFKSRRPLRAEGLEPRMMLAGDVLTLAESCAATLHGDDSTPGYVVGDANRDGHFDQLDIVAVLEAGKYRTDQPANWSEGDWNGDDVFDQRDLILALQSWPDQISLPTGFEPEGITLGKGQEFFVGAFSYSSFFGPLFEVEHPESALAGAVYKGNLCSGEGQILVQPTENLQISGLSYDTRTDYLYAVTQDATPIDEATTGQGVSIYNGTTGDLAERYVFAGDGLLINDVLVTSKAVYATDSYNPTLYKLPLDRGGQPSGDWEAIPMDGFDMIDGEINANGLVGDFDADELVVINIASGILYHVDTNSGAATAINVQGPQNTFPSGDGLYMQGRTLYIMQNQFGEGEPGKIAVVQLSGDLTGGTFVKDITSDDFANPTSIVGFGDSIYALNSQGFPFILGDPSEVHSQVVKVDKVAVESDSWPELISLPVGFEPKDIEVGQGDDFFVGAYSWSSLLAPRVDLEHPVSGLAGAIYKGNLRTGEGQILVPANAENPRPVLGLSYDPRTDHLYAAVGDPATLDSFPNQGIAVYNGTTGELIDEIIIGDGVFLSNVLVTDSAVFATTTTQGVIFRIPLEAEGKLPSQPTFESIELTGFEPANGFYAWGIAGDDQDLIVLNGLNGSGVLYRVDPATGASTPITVQGTQQTFELGDELYLSDRTLYIMQVFANSVAVVQLSDDLTEGTFVTTIECGECRSPHGIAAFGDSIYAVNSNVLFDPEAAAEDRIFGDPAQVQSAVVKLHK